MNVVHMNDGRFGTLSYFESWYNVEIFQVSVPTDVHKFDSSIYILRHLIYSKLIKRQTWKKLKGKIK